MSDDFDNLIQDYEAAQRELEIYRQALKQLAFGEPNDAADNLCGAYIDCQFMGICDDVSQATIHRVLQQLYNVHRVLKGKEIKALPPYARIKGSPE